MRTKEFLSQKRIDFLTIDVLNDADGRQQLADLGALAVPVLARGRQYIFCQNLEDIAEFVGLEGSGHTPLPPAELMARWNNVLRSAQRYVRQIPDARLAERAIENRDRSIRLLAHHVFRIVEAFLETAVDGVEYRISNANVPPAPGECTTGAEIARYGEDCLERLGSWWMNLDDKSCSWRINTFYGSPPAHQLLERSTWHSAQHTRQLMAILERFEIEPQGRLTASELAGLPLPEGLWE